MTQSFDEWFRKHHAVKTDYSSGYILGAERGFKAGAQSKQAEIDEYKEVAESMEDSYLKEKTKVDELRKRIDLGIESLKLVNHALLYEHIDHIINLLDGTTNEQ